MNTIYPPQATNKQTPAVIGYTTGVFDLFHIGHLNIIKRAREHCDYLIVGVSTDELVLEYKHHRPIIPFNERVEIVKALKYVDQVIPQVTMDKFQAWQEYHFNRLFHGNDWKGSAMYEEMERKLKAVGVEMVYFPYTQGTCSTKLSETLRIIRESNC